MVSPTLEEVSPTNSMIRRVKRADAIGRLRARSQNYVWLFGLVHVKHLLVFTHVVIMVISLWLMWEVGLADFTGLEIPGLDGFSPFDIGHHFDHAQERESIYVTTSSNNKKPYLYISQSISSVLSYLFFLSATVGSIVVLTIRGAWQRSPSSPLNWINPAYFLIPILCCVVVVGGGLLLCCIRSIRKQLQQISGRQTEQSVSLLVIDAFRFTFVPSALMWMIYLYYLYGCILSFIYVYNHFGKWSSIRRDVVNTSSTSWSYKEDVLSRLNAVNNGWHTYKSTDNPTSSRICAKRADADRSSPLISDENELSIGSETSCENNNVIRSFYSFNLSRRQLDTVQEENESQESSQTNSDTVVDAKTGNAIRM